MKMRPEFRYIRRYNSLAMKFLVESYFCNKRLRANLKELEYYKKAKPIEGLSEFYQIMIRQVIVNKMVKLYEENDRLKSRIDFVDTWQRINTELVRLHTVQY